MSASGIKSGRQQQWLGKLPNLNQINERAMISSTGVQR